MADRMNLQDGFLNAVRKKSVPVTIHIINGYTLNEAYVKSFDNYSMLVECDGRQMMIYKHAVSTITAKEKVELIEQ